MNKYMKFNIKSGNTTMNRTSKTIIKYDNSKLKLINGFPDCLRRKMQPRIKNTGEEEVKKNKTAKSELENESKKIQKLLNKDKDTLNIIKLEKEKIEVDLLKLQEERKCKIKSITKLESMEKELTMKLKSIEDLILETMKTSQSQHGNNDKEKIGRAHV